MRRNVANCFGPRALLPTAWYRYFLAGIALLVAGCAEFQHQTGLSEPHGVVRIVMPADPHTNFRVVKLDGLPVSVGREYRVRAGEHLVTVRVVESSVLHYEPVTVGAGDVVDQRGTLNIPASGASSVTGEHPFSGMQMLNVDVEDRRISYVTNSITVEAGWRYDLEGDTVSKAQINAP
jgi:hypothetical protein